MRSKIKKIIAIIFITFLLPGCNDLPEKEKTSIQNEKRMICVESSMITAIYVDTKTGVMYFGRGDSGVCVMLDADGKPVIYQEE